MLPPSSPSPAPVPTADARTRDAERSRALILAAAQDEFAQYGLGGAKVERISAAAGVDRKLVYYYFQDKDGLFAAVLESAHERLRRAQLDLDLRHVPPLAAIRRIVEFTWEFYLAYPAFITLMNSENLHQGRHIRHSARIRELNSPLIALLSDILERGCRDGLFRAGIDPMQLYITIAGCAYFYFSNIHSLSAGFGQDLSTPKMQARRLAHITDVIAAYVLR